MKTRSAPGGLAIELHLKTVIPVASQRSIVLPHKAVPAGAAVLRSRQNERNGLDGAGRSALPRTRHRSHAVIRIRHLLVPDLRISLRRLERRQSSHAVAPQIHAQAAAEVARVFDVKHHVAGQRTLHAKGNNLLHRDFAIGEISLNGAVAHIREQPQAGSSWLEQARRERLARLEVAGRRVAAIQRGGIVGGLRKADA